MIKIDWVKDLKDGMHIHDEFVINNVNKCISDKGKPYLNIILQDNSGTIAARKWDVSDQDLINIQAGKVVEVEGDVQEYRGVNQVKVIDVYPTDPSTIVWANFRKVSPIPLDEMKERLSKYLNSFTDPDVKLITNTVINKFYDKYCTYPAAIKVHHEFGNGIIHHSLAMADLADHIAKLYPSVDRDLLVAGALLHDVGKIFEYKDLPVPEQTLEGKLIGHISLMHAEFRAIVKELDIKSEVPTLLEHMILSHHGQLEFGSPVLPSTREALLLSMIDMLDSRMMVLDKALENVKPGDFSEKLWSMDNLSFYKPKERNK